MAVSDILFYLAIIPFLLIKRISFVIRKRMVIYILTLVGAVLIISAGPKGASSAYIISSFVIAGIFENRKGIISHISITVCSYAVITLLLYQGSLDNQPISLLRNTWVTILSNNLILGIVLEWIVYKVNTGLYKQSEAMILQKDELRSLIDSSHDPIITVDEQFTILDISTAGADFIGRPKEQICGRKLHELFPFINLATGKLLEEELKAYQFSLIDTKGWSLKTSVYDADRKVRYLMLSVSPVQKNSSFSANKLLFIFNDITNEHEAAEQLRKFEWLNEKEDFASYYDSFNYTPPYGDITELNSSRLILNSVGKETLLSLGKDIMSLLDTSFSVYEKSGDYAAGLFVSEWCRNLDLASRNLCKTESNEEALKSGKWLCHESCWYRNAQKAMAEDSPADSTCVGGIRLYGLPVEADGEVVGAVNIGYGNPPQDDAVLSRIALRYQIDRQILIASASAYKPRPQFIIDAAKIRLHSIARLIGEIIERKKKEKEIQKLQSLQRIGYLAGGIAHDFNNMLTGIYGYISLTKMQLDENHPAQEPLLLAENSLKRAGNLTGKLLTFSKGGEPVKTNLNLVQLIKDTAAFELSGSNVQSTYSILGDIRKIHADKTQMEQVFSNLTHNAVQAMPKGGNLFISIKNTHFLPPDQDISGAAASFESSAGSSSSSADSAAASSADSAAAAPGAAPGTAPSTAAGTAQSPPNTKIPGVQISLRDEGEGIKEEYVDHIFDPYFTTKTNGTGLGLATVYSIISKHRGEIKLATSLGKGTTFTITLPASMHEDVSDTHRTVSFPEKDLSRLRILVMDDEADIRNIMHTYLSPRLELLSTAESADQAVHMFTKAYMNSHPYHLVILDLTIPGGRGGFAVLQEIQKIDPSIRAIAMSGYSADHARIKNHSEFFADYLEKPFQFEDLLQTISALLDDHASSSE